MPLEVITPSVVVVSSRGPGSACARTASVRLVPECVFGPHLSRPPVDAESPTVGVGHRATASLNNPLRWPGPPPLWSVAVGVGHSFAAIASGVPHPFPFPCFSFRWARRASRVLGLSPFCATEASGVGQKEEPLPSVRRTNVGRAKHAPFRIVPQVGQAPEYDLDSESNKVPDVLHVDVARSHFANDPSVLAPQPGADPVDDAVLLPGDADVLTRESANDEIHASTPRATVEGGDVRPDRRRIQPTVRHARSQYRRSVSFPLHVADRSSDSSVAESKIESADAGEETDGT